MSLVVLTSEGACPAASPSPSSVMLTGASGISFAMVATTDNQMLATPIATSQPSSPALPSAASSSLSPAVQLASETSSITTADNPGMILFSPSTIVQRASVGPLSAGNMGSILTPATGQAQSALSTTMPTTTSGSGQPSVTLAPLIPLMDTSSLQNGALRTYIQVTANSTISSATVMATSNSFFDNHGAVAGTFVVVGMIGTACLACLYSIWTRQRRRRQHRRHRSRQSTIWPDKDSKDGTAFREVTVNDARLSILFAATNTRISIGDVAKPETLSTSFAGVAETGAMNKTEMGYDSVGADVATMRVYSLASSSVLSTPSIYSITPPPTDVDRLGDAREAKTSSVLIPPPRPPRRLRPPLTVEEIAALASRVANTGTLPPVTFNTVHLPSRLPLPLSHHNDDPRVGTSKYSA
ncbi:hypothetical protein F5I97DRAFT_1929822 [Phlebopus sp. FC_14]|nr:hypothetical protein F5I97DRAFT_1929822 [Phlebopus sp. FC_14]